MSEQLVQAFSTPIFLRNQAGSPELNQTLAQLIKNLSKNGTSDDAYRAHQGGFYTDGGLFESDLPGIPAMKALAEQGTEAYLSQISGGKPVLGERQYISWAALTRERDYQTPHVHAGATLSGVYYVQVPEKPEPEGCIDLLTPIDAKELTFLKQDATTFCRVPPKAGDLLMFPAYLKHFTHPFFGEGERICIVFNVKLIQQQRQGINSA